MSDPQTPATEACGHIFTDGSRCHLAAGHNMGKADIPANHARTDQTPATEAGRQDDIKQAAMGGPDFTPYALDDQCVRTLTLLRDLYEAYTIGDVDDQRRQMELVEEFLDELARPDERQS